MRLKKFSNQLTSMSYRLITIVLSVSDELTSAIDVEILIQFSVPFSLFNQDDQSCHPTIGTRGTCSTIRYPSDPGLDLSLNIPGHIKRERACNSLRAKTEWGGGEYSKIQISVYSTQYIRSVALVFVRTYRVDSQLHAPLFLYALDIT